MRRVVEQYPSGFYYNTLGTAEYRMENYHLAIEACTKPFDLARKEMDHPDFPPHPSHLAILAMSHLKLGHTDDVNKFRDEFDEAMKHAFFKDAPECLSFAEELTALFNGQNGEKQDQEPQAGQTRDPDEDRPDEQ